MIAPTMRKKSVATAATMPKAKPKNTVRLS